jgi:hypothetical protein
MDSGELMIWTKVKWKPFIESKSNGLLKPGKGAARFVANEIKNNLLLPPTLHDTAIVVFRFVVTHP